MYGGASERPPTFDIILIYFDGFTCPLFTRNDETHNKISGMRFEALLIVSGVSRICLVRHQAAVPAMCLTEGTEDEQKTRRKKLTRKYRIEKLLYTLKMVFLE